MEVKIETQVFEGPLELLLYLIKKREVNIYDIPIAEITQEFLLYIEQMRELNIPLASEFLLMAATLAKIKSEYLLFREEESGEDPRKELVQLIEDYLKAKRAASELEKLEDKALRYLPHNPSSLIFEFQEKIKIANTKEELQRAYREVLRRHFKPKIKVGMHLSSESFKVSEKVKELRALLKRNLLLRFSSLVEKSSCKLEAITYFLAVLELSKMGEASTFTDGEEIFVSCVLPLSRENSSLSAQTYS
jgi:segregation and condensation protein A